MFCRECNSENDDRTTVCIYCGAELDKKESGQGINEECMQHSPENTKLESLLSRDYKVKIEQYIVSGWGLFKKDMGSYITYSILLGAIGLFAVFAARLAAPLIGGILMSVFGAGIHIFALKRMTGEQPEFKDFFEAFNYFMPLSLNYIVKAALIILGYLCFILPGIYLSVAFSFDTFLVTQKKQDFWDAMQISRKMVSKHWFLMLGFFITVAMCTAIPTIAVIAIMALIAFRVGMPAFFLSLPSAIIAIIIISIACLPFTRCVAACAYKDIFEPESHNK